MYEHLHSYFPQAQFVFVVRDPRDNIRSILDRLNLPGNVSELSALQRSAVSPAWKLVLDSRWLGFPEGSYIEMLATRWNVLADILHDRCSRPLIIRYEDFVADKCGTIGHLAAQLGMRAVNEISHKVDVQFQPRGRNRDLSWSTFFGSNNLSLIEQRCAHRMQYFGYPGTTRLPDAATKSSPMPYR